MALKRYRKRIVQAKVEAAAGTAEDLAAADAVLCGDVSVTPLAGDTAERSIIRAYFGAQERFNVRQHALIELTVELASSGAKGTVPQWGKLLQGCGMAETVTNNTSVAYTPISDGEKTLTIAANIDGVEQVLKGCRGTFSLAINAQAIPTLQFRFVGQYAAPADKAAVAADYTAWKPPLPATRAQTMTFGLLGSNGLSLHALSLDYGAEAQYEEPLSGDAEVVISDRQSSGQLTVLAPQVATLNLVDKTAQGERGALTLQHGAKDGQIVKLEMPRVALASPSYGEDRGVWTIQANYQPLPVAGNDEIKITAL